MLVEANDVSSRIAHTACANFFYNVIFAIEDASCDKLSRLHWRI